MLDIAFVGCSKVKRDGLLPAHRLYDSPLFRRAYWYATNNHAHVYILSAKHGILNPDQRIQQYDVSLAGMSRVEQRRWAARIAVVIHRVMPPGSRLSFYCGRLYWRDLAPQLTEYSCRMPVAGLRIGEQLSWYAREGYSPEAVSW
jgi:hypothetical protein